MNIHQRISDMNENYKNSSELYGNFITKVVFPNFKNLQKDSYIEFQSPLIVLVGRNGSGKSSVLRAINGAPVNKSPGEYRFSTKIDPMEGSKLRPSMRYAFREGIYGGIKKEKEVLKERIHKGEDPTYWETARPQKRYGMSWQPEEIKKEIGNSRFQPIDKEVLYIDCKSQASAFDKFFYYYEDKINFPTREKQAKYIANQSKKLSNVFNGKKTIYYQRKIPQNEQQYELSTKEINYIKKIIGKEYTHISGINHKFYKHRGITSKYSLDKHTYSDHFAGSGEMLIIKLIRDIQKLPSKSLILLDEPETSLHPEAQKELLNYIVDVIKEKKHQVIISTHSPILVKYLERVNLKLFKNFHGKYEVIENVSPDVVFDALGHEYENKKVIFCEDKLSVEIIDKCMKFGSNSCRNSLVIQSHPGGSGQMRKTLFNDLALDRAKYFYCFDGDVKNDAFDNVPEYNKGNQGKEVKNIIKRLKEVSNNSNLEVIKDSGLSIEQQHQLYVKIIEGILKHVYFLPSQTPEEFIWSNETLHGLAKSYGKIIHDSEFDRLDNFKDKFRKATKLLHERDESDQIFIVQKDFLSRFVEYEKLEKIKNDLKILLDI